MAAVASVEALHYLNTNQSIKLSVQELIDCSTKNNGCKGGWSQLALEYIMENGISAESSYPYKARNSLQGCRLSRTAASTISNVRLVNRTEDALEEAVAKQPVIVSLQYTHDLSIYRGGIMEYGTLPPVLPDGNLVRHHAVLIVGYGTTNGVKYWRFKNSWGNTWGEGGFGRIRRHVSDERGVMGMFIHPPVYPVLDM
jgi:C1A family cysteine protease